MPPDVAAARMSPNIPSILRTAGNTLRNVVAALDSRLAAGTIRDVTRIKSDICAASVPRSLPSHHSTIATTNKPN
jgi:hypothetical protein